MFASNDGICLEAVLRSLEDVVDNVIDEFKKEKKTLVDSKKPKDLDLTLPGWGEWGGGGLMPSKRKRRRFTIKAPPAEKRRDENSGHLILNTDKDTKLRKHQVSNVPFPFTAVSDFEVMLAWQCCEF